MIQVKAELTPKKIAAVVVLSIAVIAAILFQVFWTPDKEIIADSLEIKKQKFLQILVAPQVGTLYALDPTVPDAAAGFRGYKILNQTKLSPEDVASVAFEFKDAVDTYEESLGAKDCFNPTLGLQVVKDGKTADFLMSYDCFVMKVFGDRVEYSFRAAGSPTKLDDMLKASSNQVDSETVEPLE